MTTICAVKKGKRICIASDSLARIGSRKEILDNHVQGDGKILKIGSNFIATAGHPSWELILKQYFLERKNISAWESADQVFDVFNALHQDLKKHYFLAPPLLRHIPIESSEFEFLIVNPFGIFEVDYARVVRHHLHFTAMGSGEDYALGGIKAVFNLIEDPAEIAKSGIEAAVQFDRKTSFPVQIQCLDL